MSDTKTQYPWHFPVAVNDLPEDGQHFALVADEGARAAVAKLAGLRALPRLEATFQIVPQGSRGVHVTGTVAATVGQTCVVTLEPIDNEVEEDVDLVFKSRNPAQAPERIAGTPGEEIAEDDIELLDDGIVDLGALATEFLILGLDPYPRKPGVAFEPPRVEEAATSPFAALGALKRGEGTD